MIQIILHPSQIDYIENDINSHTADPLIGVYVYKAVYIATTPWQLELKNGKFFV